MTIENETKIIINPENCTGCRICQLWCSYIYYKTFSIELAHLEIINEYGLELKIKFLDSCLNCGQCSERCLYGALLLKDGGEIKNV
ncbi:MAG: hypothetical protein ACTSPW_20390 [Promethearchaeota archaeon]